MPSRPDWIERLLLVCFVACLGLWAATFPSTYLNHRDDSIRMRLYWAPEPTPKPSPKPPKA